MKREFAFIDMHHHLSLLPFLGPAMKYIQKQEFTIHYMMKLLDERNQKGIVSGTVYNFPLVHWGLKGARSQIDQINKVIRIYGDRVRIIRSAADLEGDYTLGIVWQLESARWLENWKVELDQLWEWGVRGVIPLHFKNNRFGKCCDSPHIPYLTDGEDTGLSDDGKQLVEYCQQLGMWVDGSHMSDKTMDDYLKLYKRRPLLSHMGLREYKNTTRNVSQKNSQQLFSQNGLVCFTPWKDLVGGRKLLRRTIMDQVAAGRENQIAIGTDFGAPVWTSRGLHKYHDMFKTISQWNWSGDQLEKFMWRNAFDFLSETLPK